MSSAAKMGQTRYLNPKMAPSNQNWIKLDAPLTDSFESLVHSAKAPTWVLTWNDFAAK